MTRLHLDAWNGELESVAALIEVGGMAVHVKGRTCLHYVANRSRAPRAQLRAGVPRPRPAAPRIHAALPATPNVARARRTHAPRAGRAPCARASCLRAPAPR